MHTKFLDHDTGSGRAAIQYLLQEHDHSGEIRAEVRVMRGNPHQVGRLIDSLEFVNRYRSAVIAFHRDDAPTEVELQDVLNRWEALAFAGLTPDQYTWTAVLHRDDDGSCHIHVVVPRVELSTGKSLNIAPPGWQKAFDSFRDMLNYERGWARPDDPARSKLLQDGTVGRFFDWKNGDDYALMINQMLEDEIVKGRVFDRVGI